MTDAERDDAMAYLRALVAAQVDRGGPTSTSRNALKVIDPVHLAEWRLHTAQRETAHERAATVARRSVELAMDQLDEMNVGSARGLLRDLVTDGLPNDHGGPVTHYPLFEQALEQIVVAERAR